MTHNTKISDLFPTSVVIPYTCGLYWALSFVGKFLDDRYCTELYLPQYLGAAKVQSKQKKIKREKGKKENRDYRLRI